MSLFNTLVAKQKPAQEFERKGFNIEATEMDGSNIVAPHPDEMMLRRTCNELYSLLARNYKMMMRVKRIDDYEFYDLRYETGKALQAMEDERKANERVAKVLSTRGGGGASAGSDRNFVRLVQTGKRGEVVEEWERTV